MLSACDVHNPKSLAMIFPGQGSQYSGMAMDLAEHSLAARKILERGNDLLGYELTKIMAGHQGDALNRTVHTQPAVFLHSMALLAMLREKRELKVVVAAGHSLGEYSALVCAGVLEFEAALDLVRIRAKAMDEAQPPGTCGMAAVVGLSRDEVLEVVQSCRGGDILEAANFNAPDQVVVSGHSQALQRVTAALRTKRRARVIPLPVSSAFHTSLMGPARQALAERLADIAVHPPAFPVLSNVTAQPYPDSEEETKRLLMDQVVRPVRWEDCMRAMVQTSAEVFAEIGPGKVLAGLLRRVEKSAQIMNVFDVSSVQGFLEAVP